MLCILLVSSRTHITLSPSYGAESGRDFLTSVNVEGRSGFYTSGLVLHLPRGLAASHPEVPAGWSVNISSQVEDDGAVSKKLTWTANTFRNALQADHLLRIALHLELSCEFSDPVKDDFSGSNSVWQSQYTLWFKAEQHFSVDDTVVANTTLFAAALRDRDDGTSPSWHPPEESGLEPCPYLFIHSGPFCNSGKGMLFTGSYVQPDENVQITLQRQHMVDMLTQAATTAEESLEEVHHHSLAYDMTDLLKLGQRVAALEEELHPMFALATVAVALSGLMLVVFFLLLCIVQCSNRASSPLPTPVSPPSVPSAVVIATPLQEDINSL